MTAVLRNITPPLFSLLLGIAYAVLFYHAEMGINLLIFDGILIISALTYRPELAQNKAFTWSLGGLLFAALAVIIVHGPEAMLAHHLTYFVVLGFAQARELKFIWYGFLLGVISYFRAPWDWLNHRKQARAEQSNETGPGECQFKKWLKQGLLPLFILLPFLLFYLVGNAVISSAVESFFSGFSLFDIGTTPFWILLLTLLGGSLSLALLFPRLQPSWMVEHQLGFDDQLLRRRDRDKTFQRWPTPGLADGFQASSGPLLTHKMLALRGHYRQAVITFVLLNALLAIVNFTDLAFVWLPAHELSAATLSHYVHVGTWNLTFSIGLAMLVVLYYFRGNLNFLANTPLLRPLARLWLAQNALLALSVGVRNYHYIDAYGLAGGRVIVGFVLLLILFGLYTLLKKANQQLSFTYLMQTNGIAAWLLLLAFSTINWSVVITRYNLATQPANKVDWYYLRSGLDNRNTFLILDHLDTVQGVHSKTVSYYYQPADWRSWNYADWRNLRALNTGADAGPKQE